MTVLGERLVLVDEHAVLMPDRILQEVQEHHGYDVRDPAIVHLLVDRTSSNVASESASINGSGRPSLKDHCESVMRAYWAKAFPRHGRNQKDTLARWLLSCLALSLSSLNLGRVIESSISFALSSLFLVS